MWNKRWQENKCEEKKKEEKKRACRFKHRGKGLRQPTGVHVSFLAIAVSKYKRHAHWLLAWKSGGETFGRHRRSFERNERALT